MKVRCHKEVDILLSIKDCVENNLDFKNVVPTHCMLYMAHLYPWGVKLIYSCY